MILDGIASSHDFASISSLCGGGNGDQRHLWPGVTPNIPVLVTMLANIAVIARAVEIITLAVDAGSVPCKQTSIVTSAAAEPVIDDDCKFGCAVAKNVFRYAVVGNIRGGAVFRCVFHCVCGDVMSWLRGK